MHSPVANSPVSIHTDCRHYRGSMPCTFHKKEGRLCPDCRDYAPLASKILIVKLAAIGDVLRTTSILPRLRDKYPSSEITWLTKANAKPLLEENPFVDRVLTVEDTYLPYLQNESFDVGICLDADPLSATLHSIARCDSRFGFRADASGRVQPVDAAAVDWWLMGLNDQMKKTNRKTYQHVMYEICGLPLPTVPPQLYLDPASRGLFSGLRQESGLSNARKVVGINTGGGGRWQLKKWTLDGYIDCINLLKQRHPDVGLLLLGGPEEVELNKRILCSVGRSVTDGGCNNSLMQFASLIDGVDVLLTSDSLAMHIGVALRKPTIVLVGPTAPWELDVFGNGAVLHSDIECLACYLSRCNKATNCMNTLSSDYVASKIAEYL